ncbi:hypothetical protein [Bifidobacterium simiarum]|nr:hypothetical protein [Bifidobacterium simiarum]
MSGAGGAGAVVGTAIETTWSGTVTDEQQPKPPYKVGVALALVTFL